ncbi:hypothetical protein FACS1894151_09590 [Spirochaetia bacterium]|nr:hypothetical protein FACS1894151_09590 [Spirochaetia bacterium]
MAMDGDTMGDAVAAALAQVIASQGQGQPDIDRMKTIWETICNEIVDHIKQNAVVMSGITLTTPDTINGTTTGNGRVI